MTQPVLVWAFIIKFMSVNALLLKEQYTKYKNIFSHLHGDLSMQTLPALFWDFYP